MARLGDVCKIQSGGTPSRAESAYWDNGSIPWVKISDIKDKSLNNTEEYITEAGLANSSAKIFPAGTILYTIFATLGEVCILNINASTNQAIAGIQVESNLVFTDYLYYYLISQKYAVSKMGRGVAQNNINMKMLREFEVPLPPLEEQRRIAALLDKVSDLIAKRRAQLDKLDLLVKARFVEMFGDCRTNPKGWKTCCLEDIAEVGSSKRVFVEELKENGIPFYRGTEVGALAEGLTITPELFITKEHYKELCDMSGKPQKGDLLMPSICPDGRIWLVDTDDPFYFKDGRVLWVHSISDKFDPVFLLYTLKDKIMADYGSIASGTTFAELKIFALKKCKVFNVPFEIQKQFSSFIQSTSKSKLTIQQSLDKLETLKKSLMQQYFGG